MTVRKKHMLFYNYYCNVIVCSVHKERSCHAISPLALLNRSHWFELTIYQSSHVWRVEISATYPPPLLTFVYGEIAMFPFTLYLFAILLLSASVLRSRSRPRKDRIRNTAVVSQVGPLTMFSSVDIKHGNIGTICKQYHFTVLQNIFRIKKDRTSSSSNLNGITKIYRYPYPVVPVPS